MYLGGITLGFSGFDFEYVSLKPFARAFNNVTVYGGNVIIDKLKIENYEMLDTDLENIDILWKQQSLELQLNQWYPDTTLLSAEFSNTMDGGNVINLPGKVTQWQLYRQEVGSTTLELISTLQA